MIIYDKNELSLFISRTKSFTKTETKTFLQTMEIQKLLSKRDFQQIFDLAIGNNISTACLTAIFLLSDIDFLNYLTELPTACFKDVPIQSIIIPDNIQAIEGTPFYSCKTIQGIIFNDNIKDLAPWSFDYCENLEGIRLPKYIDRIPSYCFQYCYKLKDLAIPETVKNIDEFAFNFCDSLDILKYRGTTDQWDAIQKNSYWNNNSKIKIIKCIDGEIELM